MQILLESCKPKEQGDKRPKTRKNLTLHQDLAATRRLVKRRFQIKNNGYTYDEKSLYPAHKKPSINPYNISLLGHMYFLSFQKCKTSHFAREFLFAIFLLPPRPLFEYNMCNILQQCDFYGFYYSSVALVKSPFSESVSFGCSPLPTSAIICKLSSPSKSYSAKKITALLC